MKLVELTRASNSMLRFFISTPRQLLKLLKGNSGSDKCLPTVGEENNENLVKLPNCSAGRDGKLEDFTTVPFSSLLSTGVRPRSSSITGCWPR
ncbi:MAG: hypothetical protein ACLGRW_03185 [Acidobacteriota bacterium]